MRTRLHVYPFVAILAVALPFCSARPAEAQQYRNIVNQHFATVSSGPMQAIVVDVPDATDRAAVHQSVKAAVAAARQARASGLQRELSLMQRMFRWKRPPTAGVPDIVFLRQNGKLVLPPNRAITRGPNQLTFNFPLSKASNDEGWTSQQIAQLVPIANILNSALQNIVYGAPAWSGTVQVLDGDNAANIVSDPNALSGGTYNVSTGEITIAQYNALQSTVLNLCQMMAIAYHGPDSISYDAWERGMARAATVETIMAVQPNLDSLLGAGTVTANDPLWVSLDRYDLMNQPPLGNDHFFPVSQVNGVANTSSFPNMLVPRLMMSGSAWLKCQAESTSFLSQFNQSYYAAFKTDPSIANNVPALKSIASGVLPTVEGMQFTSSGGTPGWYEQQYVLDTSISPGYKEYALPSALVPQDATDDPAIAVILYYYQTTFDAHGNSNEVDLNGTTYPIYWDNTFTNRLFLGAQYESVDIRSGIGAVAPTFPNTLGGANGNNMRIAMDFPIGAQNVRLYVAPRNMVSSSNSLQPNNFWGTVVGTDTGTLHFQTDTGVDTTVQVVQGAFGTNITAGNPFTRPSKATMTFTDTANKVTVRHVNVGFNEYIPVLYTGNPVQSVTQNLPAGPAMISFPIQPFAPLAANALLNPSTGQPLFGPGNLLMATWRQDINATNGDDYLVYPTLGALVPGTGYWTDFASPTQVMIYGRVATPDQQVSRALLYGWNQIGNPYTTAIPLSSLTFQDQANNVGVDLTTAISNGWIGVTSFPNIGSFPVFGFDQSLGYVPVTSGTTGNNMLQPGQGYWIRVAVSEGVTVTFANPTPGGKAVTRSGGSSRAAAAAPPPGWALPITVRSPEGYGATAWIGQSSAAQTGFNPKMDALSPPAPFSAMPRAVFRHPELGANAGDYMTEVHAVTDATPWELTVTTPDPKKTYTLTWSSLATLSRGVQLTLVDEATGAREYMRTTSGYSFTPGSTPTRKFQVIAENQTQARLMITSVRAESSSRAPGAATAIQFSLSQAATIGTQVLSSNGTVVRHLLAGRAEPEGTSSVLWDMRDDRGRPVATGSYLIHITATSPSGETVRTVQPLTVVR